MSEATACSLPLSGDLTSRMLPRRNKPAIAGRISDAKLPAGFQSPSPSAGAAEPRRRQLQTQPAIRQRNSSNSTAVTHWNIEIKPSWREVPATHLNIERLIEATDRKREDASFQANWNVQRNLRKPWKLPHTRPHAMTGRCVPSLCSAACDRFIRPDYFFEVCEARKSK
ncbi:hypothetical protein WKW79_02880 [Variovorax robiniae]|uniref:Uncharacterized protein n=1 Tax=Variovorax robiniae TaxID=1836199 RepID=A0ABU8X1F8_9BURK